MAFAIGSVSGSQPRADHHDEENNSAVSASGEPLVIAWERPMSWFQLVVNDWRVSVGVTLVALAFFGGWTIYSLLRSEKKAYVRGLALVDAGILSSLVRNLFFYDLSAHPARPGGWWRFLTAAVILWGFVLVERAFRQERLRTRNKPVDQTVT
jgi:hypothetical protein